MLFSSIWKCLLGPNFSVVFPSLIYFDETNQYSSYFKIYNQFQNNIYDIVSLKVLVIDLRNNKLRNL